MATAPLVVMANSDRCRMPLTPRYNPAGRIAERLLPGNVDSQRPWTGLQLYLSWLVFSPAAGNPDPSFISPDILRLGQGTFEIVIEPLDGGRISCIRLK
jgi:hypothetical protein